MVSSSYILIGTFPHLRARRGICPRFLEKFLPLREDSRRSRCRVSLSRKRILISQYDGRANFDFIVAVRRAALNLVGEISRMRVVLKPWGTLPGIIQNNACSSSAL